MQISGGIERTISTALGRSVNLKWTGKPASGIRFRQNDVFLIPFSALWFGFTIVWESAVLASNAPWYFKLWGVPFLLVGFFIFAGRFLVDAYLREHTVYAVSDTGAYIVRDGLFPSFVTYNLLSTVAIEMRPHADGSGTLTFGPRQSSWYGGGWSMWLDSQRDFVGIPNVAKVYALVTSAANAPNPASSWSA